MKRLIGKNYIYTFDVENMSLLKNEEPICHIKIINDKVFYDDYLYSDDFQNEVLEEHRIDILSIYKEYLFDNEMKKLLLEEK